MRARYGDAVRFNLLNGRGVAFVSPELAREVFAADLESFEVEAGIVSLFGTRAVLATSGAEHRRQRKLLNPRFHGGSIRGLLETIQRAVRECVEGLGAAASSGNTVRVLELAQTITQNVILEAVFGSDESIDRPAARELLGRFVRAIVPSLFGITKLHTSLYPPWRTFVQCRAAFDAWVDAIMLARRRSGALGTDILGSLLEARYDDGSPIDDGEIRDQLMTLLFAGYETTATAIAWGVHWLLRETDVLARLRAEIDALGSAPPVERLVRLPYLEAVASESLRVEPIVTFVSRVCRVPVQIGPWTVPAGEIASVNLLGILGDETLYPEPERFRPERFLERSFTATEFLPFGGGQRRCLGAAFAQAELALALAVIATEWELTPADPAPERAVRKNLTMGPERGVPVRVQGRRARAAAGPPP
jgi:cytochrome P450